MITKCLSPLFVRQLYIQGFLSFPHILKLCIINKGVFIYLVFFYVHMQDVYVAVELER